MKDKLKRPSKDFVFFNLRYKQGGIWIKITPRSGGIVLKYKITNATTMVRRICFCLMIVAMTGMGAMKFGVINEQKVQRLQRNGANNKPHK